MITKSVTSALKYFLVWKKTNYDEFRFRKYEQTYQNVLLRKEKKLIADLWGFIPGKINYNFYKVAKSFASKEDLHKFVSTDIFYPYILRSLNPVKFSGAYEFKGTYHRLFNINQPKYFVNAIGNTIFDNKGNIVTNKKEIIDLLIEKSFIVKPTIDSACGSNIIAIQSATEKDVLSILENYKSNFIIQEICRQSDKTKVFNESSLNTFRVTTLFLNNHFSVLNILFRCGRGNTIVDNGGAGGLMCGCDTDGQLMPYALDNNLKKYTKSSTGQSFGVKIPEVKSIINTIKEKIDTIPFCSLAGWDFALDDENRPVMIEVNLGGSTGIYPGILTEQLCNETPLFGERTHEVINWVKNNSPQICELLIS